MTTPVNRRQSMLLSGLLQGIVMLGLHEWFKTHGFQASNLVLAAPLYAMAVLGPITFNWLRGEFPIRQSLASALMATLTIAATAGWYGWSAVSADGADVMRGYWSGGAFVFGSASLATWFVALPFLQSGLRARSLRFPYASLFADAWRNTLLLANCLMFTGLFWLLLMLWAGLFSVLKISFFMDVFTSRFFFYLATAMAVSFAVSLEQHEASALTTKRRHLLAFQTRLLPLAALIVLLFLSALPFSGVQSLWNTGHATPLMLCLQLAIIALTNAAWQDGEQAAPFSQPTQWLVRAALALLPVLAVLCIWSLSLRITQYGWTVDRVWAVVLVGLTSLYALGYAQSAIRSGWLPSLGKFNARIAVMLIVTLLAIHTPLLDPQRISAASQTSRLLSGMVDAEHFDYAYLRFNLGRAGNAVLQEMTVLANHPKAATIRSKAKEALEKKDRYSTHQQPTPGKTDIAAKLKPYPAGTRIDPAFVDYIDKRLGKNGYDYDLSSLRNNGKVLLLAIDLGGSDEPEYLLMARPYPVFTRESQGWRQVGQINFVGTYFKDADIETLLQNGDYARQSRQWSDLKLGDKFGSLMLRPVNEP